MSTIHPNIFNTTTQCLHLTKNNNNYWTLGRHHNENDIIGTLERRLMLHDLPVFQWWALLRNRVDDIQIWWFHYCLLTAAHEKHVPGTLYKEAGDGVMYTWNSSILMMALSMNVIGIAPLTALQQSVCCISIYSSYFLMYPVSFLNQSNFNFLGNYF